MSLMRVYEALPLASGKRRRLSPQEVKKKTQTLKGTNALKWP